jgi:hypothetical protein
MFSSFEGIDRRKEETGFTWGVFRRGSPHLKFPVLHYGPAAFQPRLMGFPCLG